MISIESPQITMTSRSSLLTSKIAVRDSFDDEEISDDADDEVFIQDGRNGLKHDDDRGLKRPLMPPRRKNFKTTPFQSNRHRRAVVRALWAPCCYAMLFISIFLIVIGLVVALTNTLLSTSTPWSQQRATDLVAPSLLLTQPVWNVSLPRLFSESNLQLVDVNSDGTLDVLFGYSTAVNQNSDPGFVCAMYFNSKYPCYGGVLALDGRSGDVLWQHWTEEGVLALDCSADITGDGTKDCLSTGRKGLFCALNGRDGNIIWHVSVSDQQSVRSTGDIFSPRFINDIDGDRVQDIVSSHTGTGVCGHSTGHLTPQGHVLLMSGATGKTLQCLPTPSHAESFTMPQFLVWPDGGSLLLVGTGGANMKGGLHVIPLHPQQGLQAAKSRLLYSSSKNGGLVTSILLADITGDGTEDIIAAMFDSVVTAFDGISFNMLWNYTIPSSELHSPISAGYYNDDDTPDFLIRFHLGPGFPSYHNTQTQVLDGKTGKPLLSKPINAAPSSDSAPSVSLEGHGNDAFLVWSSGCLARENGAAAKNDPLPPTARESIEGDWDKCDPKFNATSSDLRLFTNHLPPPGLLIFHTEETPETQEKGLKNDFDTASSYVAGHPDFWADYAALLCSTDSNAADTPVEAPEQPEGYPPRDDMQVPTEREQIEDVNYQSIPHQVRKHGKQQPIIHRKYYPPSAYADYDTPPQVPQQENGNSAYEEIFRRPIREAVAPDNSHKILSTHLSSAVTVPRLQIVDEGVDLIFTSHWSAPRDTILSTFQQCLASRLSQQRLNRKHLVLNCQHQAQIFAKECWNEVTRQPSSDSSLERPFGATRMSHMMVHRVSLQLQCQDLKSATPRHRGQRCAGILPWNLQSLPANPSSSSLFKKRNAGVFSQNAQPVSQ